MRDYSKPWYDIPEMASAFNGVCKCLGKEEYCCDAIIPTLGSKISALARIEGIEIPPTTDGGTTGVNLQRLIDHLIDHRMVTRESLRLFVDTELEKLPKHPFINYFED